MSKKGLYELTPRKGGVFLAYVDKKENRKKDWLHNFFYEKYIFLKKGLGIFSVAIICQPNQRQIMPEMPQNMCVKSVTLNAVKKVIIYHT